MNTRALYVSLSVPNMLYVQWAAVLITIPLVGWFGARLLHHKLGVAVGRLTQTTCFGMAVAVLRLMQGSQEVSVLQQLLT